ncbi:hypothetical protein GCM10023213_43920 [Prosthecobacter algae]|uniref:Uncharacterized protein n=1 Tax=Prosthecobacter algae TaxID=1144682 RepID=A0ABP9PLP1_9BACT
MHLLCNAQGLRIKTQLGSLLTVPAPQALHHNRTIRIHRNLRMPQRETMAKAGQAVEEGKGHPKRGVHGGQCHKKAKGA